MSHARLTPEEMLPLLKDAMRRHLIAVNKSDRSKHRMPAEIKESKFDEALDPTHFDFWCQNFSMRFPESVTAKLHRHYNELYDQWFRTQNASEDYEKLLTERLDYINSLINLQNEINNQKNKIKISSPTVPSESKRTEPTEVTSILNTMKQVHDTLAIDLGTQHLLPFDFAYNTNPPGMCEFTGLADLANAAADWIKDPNKSSQASLIGSANYVIKAQDHLISHAKTNYYLSKTAAVVSLVLGACLMVGAIATGGLAGLGIFALALGMFAFGAEINPRPHNPVKNIKAKEVGTNIIGLFSQRPTSESSVSTSSSSSSSMTLEQRAMI